LGNAAEIWNDLWKKYRILRRENLVVSFGFGEMLNAYEMVEVNLKAS
jgi:hypothetical protein